MIKFYEQKQAEQKQVDRVPTQCCTAVWRLCLLYNLIQRENLYSGLYS